MAGSNEARCNRGVLEANGGNMSCAIKHWMIAATAGDDTSMKKMDKYLKSWHVTKEEYEMTLHAYIVSVEEMRSGNRDKAAV